MTEINTEATSKGAFLESLIRNNKQIRSPTNCDSPGAKNQRTASPVYLL